MKPLNLRQNALARDIGTFPRRMTPTARVDRIAQTAEFGQASAPEIRSLLLCSAVSRRKL